MTDPKQRFSDRVADYIKFRPKYPEAIIEVLKENIGFDREKVVADIGAGTGFLTELFLKNLNPTFAVEPNEAMRTACENLYGNFKNLTIAPGSAEHTLLNDKSIDVIIAGQAFHWFDKKKSKTEFDRILKPNGHVVLIWNARKDDAPFSRDYDKILTDNLPEYKTLDHRNVDDEAINKFFVNQKVKKDILPNSQIFDWEGFRGRVLSSSYVPQEGTVHEKIMREIKPLYDQNQKDGQVIFEYDTVIYQTV